MGFFKRIRRGAKRTFNDVQGTIDRFEENRLQRQERRAAMSQRRAKIYDSQLKEAQAKQRLNKARRKAGMDLGSIFFGDMGTQKRKGKRRNDDYFGF